MSWGFKRFKPQDGQGNVVICCFRSSEQMKLHNVLEQCVRVDMARALYYANISIRSVIITLYFERLLGAEISRLGISKLTVSLWIHQHYATGSFKTITGFIQVELLKNKKFYTGKQSRRDKSPPPTPKIYPSQGYQYQFKLTAQFPTVLSSYHFVMSERVKILFQRVYCSVVSPINLATNKSREHLRIV